MTIRWIDDADPAWQFGSGWTQNRNASGQFRSQSPASSSPSSLSPSLSLSLPAAVSPGQEWFDKTHSSCDLANGATNCTAQFTFYGSALNVYGDYWPTQGRFFCNVDAAVSL